MVRKSLQILLLLLMAMPWAATGQTIQIGDGGNGTYSVPIDLKTDYSYGQMIYSKDDINEKNPLTRIITDIEFYHNKANDKSFDITVYMKNVSYGTFSSTSFEPVSASDIVYSGTIIPASGWTAIHLDTPFTRDPDQHLLIAINKTGGGVSSNFTWRYTSKSDTYYNTLYDNSEITSSHSYEFDPAVDLTGHIDYKLPNIKITFYPRPIPTTPIATNTYGNGTIATLSWEETGEATQWVLQYGTDENFGDATYTEVTSGFNTTSAPVISYDITGLTPETEYYARVKSFYDSYDQSAWSDVISFTPTALNALTLNESSSVGSGTSSYVPFYHHVADYENIASQFIIPATDIVDVQGGGINSLTFYCTRNTVDYNGSAFKVYVGEVDYTTLDEYAEWESLTKVYTGSVNVTDGLLTITFDAPYIYNGGNLLVGFKQNNNLGTNATSNTKWYGDEGKPEKSSMYTYGTYNKTLSFLPKTTIIYEANNGCVKPGLFSISSELRTATLTWLSKASQWQVAHATSATDDPSLNIVGTVDVMTYTFNDLTLGDHYFWVRSYCGSSEQSEWVGPISTSVGYCTPAPTSTDGQGISNVTFGKNNLIVNNDTPKAGYLDCTDQIGEVKAGYDAKIAITYATGYSYGTIIWVDLDNDLVFEESEILYKGQSGATEPTTLNAFIYIPPTQPLGDYYMRIGGADDAFDDYIAGSSTVAPNPCYSGPWACFQDYKIRLVEAPPCPPAHNIAVTSTGYTATLTWESEASEWDIAYATTSIADPDTCVIAREVDQTSYMKNDMADGYNYFWIRTHCASDVHSDWSSATEVYIGYCIPEPSYVDGNGIANVTFGSGEHMVNNDSPVTDYTDYTNLVGDMPAGVSSAIDITYATGYSYGTIIWIDWDNSLTFEESEIVYAGESEAVNPTTLNASVYVPHTTALGNYRMRIGGADMAFDEYIAGTSTEAPDPCYSDYYATFHDYTVNVTEAPSCLPAINLTATEDQSDRSVLNWTSLNTDDESWTVYYKKVSEDSYTSIQVELNDLPYTLTGLESATKYQYYVVIDCEDDDTSYPSSVCTFTTTCPEYAAIPFHEDFDSYDVHSSSTPSSRVFPSCWDYINESESYYNKQYPTIHYYNNTNYAHTEPNYLRFYCVTINGYDYDPQDQYAILTPMQNINTLRLKLYARANVIQSNYDATFKVGVMEDNNFVQVGDAITPTSIIYQQYVIPFDSYTGTGTQIAIMIEAPEAPEVLYNMNYRSVFIDDITVETIPNCIEPNGLELTASSLHSLSVQWTAGGSESNWILQYKKYEATEWIQVENYLTNNSYTLEGLEEATIYNVRVAAVCDLSSPDGISEFCEPGTFATSCNVVSTFPWVNDFEDQIPNTVPLCWDNSESGTSTAHNMPEKVWGVYTYEGNNMIRMDNYNVQSGTALINTPVFNLPATAKELTFSLAHQASCGDLTVKISTDGGTTFTDLKSLSKNNNSTSYTVPGMSEDIAISLAAYANMSVILQFYTNANYGNGAIFIDNVRVDDIPACSKPTYLACDSFTAHTATLGWTNGSEGQDAWQIAYSTEEDFDPNSVTPVAVTTNPATINGLTPNTTYYTLVRANCGGGVFSAWNKNKIAFTTAIGNAAPYDLAVISTTITTSAASVNWSRDKANDLHESFDLYYSTNENMPEVLVPESLITGITDTIYGFTTLSEETTYYVWVRDICGADGQSEWTSSIDFTTPSSCQTPDGLAESDVTISSAIISWNTYGLTDFNLRYSVDGTNWVVKENVNSPYSLTGLTANTEYTVQVQAACNTAVWSDEYRFYTECDAYTITAIATYTQNFESPVTTAEYSSSNVEMPRCWDNYSDNESACAKPHLIKAGATYNYAPSGQVLYFYGSGNGYAMLPEFTNKLNELQINFKYTTESSSYGTLSLGYITDEDVNYNTFTTIQSYDNTNNHAFISVTEYLNNLPATASRLVFHWSYLSQWGANIDDVTVSLLPSCYPVTNLSYDNVFSSTVNLSWDLYDNTQDSWQVQYATNADFTTGVNTVSADTHENFALSELTAETHYYVRVRAYCGGESYSDWCNAIDFTTTVSCPAPTNVTTTNITQQTVDISWTGESEAYNVRYGYDTPDVEFQTNFEDNQIPSGWNNSSSYPWVIVTEDNNHFMRSSNQGVANSASTISATVTLSEDGFISFDARCMGEGTTTVYDQCIFMIDDVIMFTIGANGEQWDYYIFDIEDGTHTLTWSYTKDEGVNNTGDAFSVDNIVIGYHNMHWSYVYDIATTSTQLTGLTSDTDYAIRVQGVCGGTPGNWSAIVYVGTLPEGNKVFATAGSWDNPNNWIPTGAPTLTDDVILRANVTIESGSVALANKVTRQGSPSPTITIEDGGQLFANALLTATVKKTITGYGNDNVDTNKGFHLIATPTAMDINPETASLITDDLGTAATSETATYDLYSWDGTAETQWMNYRANSFNMTNAQGYLYASRNGVEATFTGAILNNANNKTVDLVYNTTATAGTWNFIGNPFVCNTSISINDNATVNYYKIGTGDEDGILVAASGVIAPLEGIFVQATADNQEATFSRALPNTSIGNQDGILEIALSHCNNRGTSIIDNARVRFGEGNELRKFQLNAGSSKVYIPQDGTDYAVVYSKGQGRMPVNVKVAKTGEYTVSFSNEDVEFDYLHLIDNFTGADINLLIDDSYTFTASAKDKENRFILVFKTIDNNYDPTSDIFVYQNGDELIVNGDGTLQVYDVMGRFVASYEVNGNKRINASQFSNAVYIFRMVGETVKTQKIVVR